MSSQAKCLSNCLRYALKSSTWYQEISFLQISFGHDAKTLDQTPETVQERFLIYPKWTLYFLYHSSILEGEKAVYRQLMILYTRKNIYYGILSPDHY